MKDIEAQDEPGPQPTRDEEDSTSSGSSEVVVQIVGTSNDYLIRLLEKALEDKIKHRPVVKKFENIATKLEQEITSSKGKNDLQSLLINTLLREKVSDRSEAESNQKQKIILLILTIVVPLITNILQFAISFHFRNLEDGSG